jgi:putative transcriptional regulator
MVRIRIKYLLLEKNMSQKELCEKTGIGQMHISNVSNNKVKYLEFDKMEKILKALDAKVQDLIEIVDDDD